MRPTRDATVRQRIVDPLRRSFLVASSLAALAGALVVGPYGAAAAPPYVYGCTPATMPNPVASPVQLVIYNGSASTANVTTKILAGTGANLNATFGLPITSTILPTRTFVDGWLAPIGVPSYEDGTIPAAVRIVSDQRLSATLSYDLANGGDWISMVCHLVQP